MIVTSSPPTRWLKSESTGTGAYSVLTIGSSGPVTFLIWLTIGLRMCPNTSPVSIATLTNEIAGAPTLALFLRSAFVHAPAEPELGLDAGEAGVFADLRLEQPVDVDVGLDLRVEEVVETRGGKVADRQAAARVGALEVDGEAAAEQRRDCAGRLSAPQPRV